VVYGSENGVGLMKKSALVKSTPGHGLGASCGTEGNKKAPQTRGFLGVKRGNGLLSHPVSRAVPSGLEGLTSVFGMGTGVAPPL
jgi:hypothetical protein